MPEVPLSMIAAPQALIEALHLNSSAITSSINFKGVLFYEIGSKDAMDQDSSL